MTTGLNRHYGQGHLHFITFSCYHRLPLLNTPSTRDIFVQELAKVRDEMDFHLLGYVVMPEHVHLLVSEPKQGTPSTMLHKLKLRVARKMRHPKTSIHEAHLPSHSDDHKNPSKSFWQPRFYDFNVYTQGKKTEKLNYMHANPIIRKLVHDPKDWPWSSWPFYEKGDPGLLRIDIEP